MGTLLEAEIKEFAYGRKYPVNSRKHGEQDFSLEGMTFKCWVILHAFIVVCRFLKKYFKSLFGVIFECQTV